MNIALVILAVVHLFYLLFASAFYIMTCEYNNALKLTIIFFIELILFYFALAY